MRRIGKLFLSCSALAVIALLLIGVSICRYYRIYSFRSWEAYQVMAKESPPVWRDYHFGRVRAGDDVEDVIRRTSPERVERNGRWVKFNYQPDALVMNGVTVFAYDGKMVFASAWGCAWGRIFFDEMTDAQCLEKFGAPKSDPRRFFGAVPVYR
jgi:hypothetical protein